VARAGAGFERGACDHGVPREFGAGCVEEVTKDRVESEVGDENKAVVRRGINSVRVRAFLPIGIYAFALVLDERGQRSESAVGEQGHGGDAAAAVISHEEGLARGVDGQVTRAGAAGGGFVEESEGAVGGIERVGLETFSGCVFYIDALVEGVKKSAVGMEREKSGVLSGRDEFGGGKLTGGDIETRAVDAFASSCGVGAKVNEGIGRCHGVERGEHDATKENYAEQVHGNGGLPTELEDASWSHRTAGLGADGAGVFENVEFGTDLQ